MALSYLSHKRFASRNVLKMSSCQSKSCLFRFRGRDFSDGPSNTNPLSGYVSEETLQKIRKLTEQKMAQQGQQEIEFDEEEELDEEADNQQNSVAGTMGGKKIVFLSGLKSKPVLKWYTQVQADIDPVSDQWTVFLDKRNILTKTNRGLYVPSQEAALLVASDFYNQTEKVSMENMPFVDLACRSIDDMPKFRPHYTQELIQFLNCDHVCIREPSPRDYERQMEIHQPICDLFTAKMGLQLDINRTSLTLNQPQRTLHTIQILIDAMDNVTFFAFHQLAHSVKSVVTAFVLWHGLIDVQHALEAVQLEEILQVKDHGSISGTHDYKLAQVRMDIGCALLFLQSTNYPPPTSKTIDLLGDCTEIVKAMEKQEWEAMKQLKQRMYSDWKDSLDQKAKDAEDATEKKSLGWLAEAIDKRSQEEFTEVDRALYQAMIAEKKHNAIKNPHQKGQE